MNIRKQLASLIRGKVPQGWTVYDYGVTPENPIKPVLVVRQSRIIRTPSAPRLYRDTDFTVSLVEPGLDPSKVEDALDVDVDTLIDILEEIDLPGLIWGEALRVTFEDRFHGYEITATITNAKD